MPQPRRRPSVVPDPSPPPDEPQLDPLEGTEDGSDDSGTASPAVDWISDAGPEFDPGQAKADHAEGEDERRFTVRPGGETGLEVEWDPKVVKGLLRAQGSATHALIGKAETDWVWADAELGAAAPPLTRILNRYDATRLAAATGDELALLIAVAGYTGRSIKEAKAALAAKRGDELDPEAAGVMPPPIITPEGL